MSQPFFSVDFGSISSDSYLYLYDGSSQNLWRSFLDDLGGLKTVIGVPNEEDDRTFH